MCKNTLVHGQDRIKVVYGGNMKRTSKHAPATTLADPSDFADVYTPVQDTKVSENDVMDIIDEANGGVPKSDTLTTDTSMGGTPLSFGLPSLSATPNCDFQPLQSDGSFLPELNSMQELVPQFPTVSESSVNVSAPSVLAADMDFTQNGDSSSSQWMTDFLKKNDILNSANTDSSDPQAVVPYDPLLAAANAKFEDDDFEPAAIEYSSWDEKQRERVRVQPPETIDKITDFELAYIDLADLMRLMKSAGYTEEQIRQTKVKRRKLKNRNSARGSATKKRSQFNTIANTNKQLSDMVQDLRSRNTALMNANTRLQRATEQARIVAVEAVRERKAYQQELERLTTLLSTLTGSGHGEATSPINDDVPFVQ
eukprot:m.450107 g.450107  ORF g.450107 m.450107 type:complete len:368 (+) comp21509_c0_seq1:99-1202(+)